MERKFDLCFMMVKQSISFTIYLALLELKQHHKVDFGHTYNTARQFTSVIAQSQCQSFLDSLPSRGFFSLLMDGFVDAGNLEDELIVLVHCCLDEAEQEMTTCSRFLSLHKPQKADASGLLDYR